MCKILMYLWLVRCITTYFFIPQDPSQRLLAMYSMSVLSETCAEVMKPVFAEFFPVFHRDAIWQKNWFPPKHHFGVKSSPFIPGKPIFNIATGPLPMTPVWRLASMP